jgi:hypothetical protein
VHAAQQVKSVETYPAWCEHAPDETLVFLAIGALWLAAAITLSRTGGIVLPKGTLNPNVVRTAFRIAVPAIFFGWAVPVAVGLWLVIAHRVGR